MLLLFVIMFFYGSNPTNMATTPPKLVKFCHLHQRAPSDFYLLTLLCSVTFHFILIARIGKVPRLKNRTAVCQIVVQNSSNFLAAIILIHWILPGGFESKNNSISIQHHFFI